MNIIEDIQEVLKENIIKAEDVSKIKGYIEASKLYDSLVESGIANKRGNNLLSKDKTHSTSVRFNILHYPSKE